jgi:hypothetical protein
MYLSTWGTGLLTLTARLNTLRDRTGADDRLRPPLALPQKPPGYDARDIVIASRNFR